ncbi:MAG: LCP family protein, partial [Clostridia bacterium]|nr:LCP family protein [Clostridia bacterium]
MTRTEKRRLEREAKQKKVFLVLSILFTAVLAASFGWLTFSIARLNMLPTNIMWMLAGVILLTAFLLAVWAFAPLKNGKGKVRRVLAFVTALIFSVGAFMASDAVNKVYETMRAVTGGDSDSEYVGVYVMKYDDAQTLEDARDYAFAVTASYDWKNTQAAMSAMGDELGAPLATHMYDSVTDMVAALYEGEISALIVNKAYVPVLEGMEPYKTYSEDTRLLYEYEIAKPKKDSIFNQLAPKGGLNDPFTMYISGSDTRSEYLTTSLSDVNILATVNPKTKQVLLVNTPRDYYIPNPAADGSEDKLTHCGIYGVENSMQALSDLYGVEVPYYAQINFTGFQTLI